MTKLEEIIERALEEQVAKGTPMFKTYRIYAERACRRAVHEALELAAKVGCVCDHGYKSRGMVDPDCNHEDIYDLTATPEDK